MYRDSITAQINNVLLMSWSPQTFALPAAGYCVSGGVF